MGEKAIDQAFPDPADDMWAELQVSDRNYEDYSHFSCPSVVTDEKRQSAGS